MSNWVQSPHSGTPLGGRGSRKLFTTVDPSDNDDVDVYDSESESTLTENGRAHPNMRIHKVDGTVRSVETHSAASMKFPGSPKTSTDSDSTTIDPLDVSHLGLGDVIATDADYYLWYLLDLDNFLSYRTAPPASDAGSNGSGAKRGLTRSVSLVLNSTSGRQVSITQEPKHQPECHPNAGVLPTPPSSAVDLTSLRTAQKTADSDGSGRCGCFSTAPAPRPTLATPPQSPRASTKGAPPTPDRDITDPLGEDVAVKVDQEVRSVTSTSIKQSSGLQPELSTFFDEAWLIQYYASRAETLQAAADPPSRDVLDIDSAQSPAVVDDLCSETASSSLVRSHSFTLSRRNPLARSLSHGRLATLADAQAISHEITNISGVTGGFEMTMGQLVVLPSVSGGIGGPEQHEIDAASAHQYLSQALALAFPELSRKETRLLVDHFLGLSASLRAKLRDSLGWVAADGVDSDSAEIIEVQSNSEGWRVHDRINDDAVPREKVILCGGVDGWTGMVEACRTKASWLREM
ncbi:hypothetical protein M427DRAFT_63054, partial [Gonapodya prolifera JEL478]